MAALRAVFFDLDDTLVDHSHATRAAVGGLADVEGAFARVPAAELEARHADLLETLHQQVLAGRVTIEAAREERFRRLLASVTEEPIETSRAVALARAYRVRYEHAWRAVPGALDLVSRLKDAGMAIGVVTNNLTAEQELKLRACGLDRLVDALITSEAVGAIKPDPRIFTAALERLRATPDQAVMIGDAWATDVLGARAAGIRAIWLNRRNERSPNPAVAEVPSLEPIERVWPLIVVPAQGAVCDRV